jgi:chromatin remodeling complex protein RSC6
MVRVSKSDKNVPATNASATAAPAAVVPSAVESAPVAAAPMKAPRAKAARKPKVEADASASASAAPAVLENTLEAAPVEQVSAESNSVLYKMNEFSAKLQQLISLFSTVKNDYKTLEKIVNREMKNAFKITNKKRRSNVDRKPSGFIKPTRISNELAEFLGKSIGVEMARTEVSREINAYIHSNGLQDKGNGRKINPDAKLSKLLKLSKEDELTYFNLQRYMKHHFVKAEVAATVV